DIHTQIGARCMAAKVNNVLVPLSHVLQNGDQVEVITSNKQKPKEDWLRFVVTSKAKTKIKDLIKEENKRYITDGKDMITKRLKIMRMEMTNELVNQIRAYFGSKTTSDFYYRVGKGHIEVKELTKFKSDKEAKENRANKVNTDGAQDGKAVTKELKKIHGERTDSDTLLIGEDMDKIDYTLSKCCNPIAGDDVFGFVTVMDGIKIHRVSCPNAVELMSNHGNRIIKAKWTSQKELAFLAGLRITGTDRMGLVNDVTRVISNELNINMRSVTIDSKDGIFEGNIRLYVHDTSHLDTLMRKLERVDGVFDVVRFD
ncbi:MAG: bifunctional (p)ppGpp synthetase/guanosine-3',5'-bis(diphosphate) 3'-pyrophosphohydrolase, partial [Proteobacteria bacterium]